MRASTTKHPSNTHILYERTKHVHIDKYMYKNENKWSSYQPLTTSRIVMDRHYCLSLVCLNDMNDNQAPIVSREIVELRSKLYKTKEERQIFLGFRFSKTRTKEIHKQRKIFLGFSIKSLN